MSKKTDDSIERLFRKVAPQYDISHREQDWQKLEKKLDDEAKKRAALRSGWLRGTYVLLGILGIALLYYLSLPSPSSKGPDKEDLSEEITESTPQPESRGIEKKSSALLPSTQNVDPSQRPDSTFPNSSSTVTNSHTKRALINQSSSKEAISMKKVNPANPVINDQDNNFLKTDDEKEPAATMEVLNTRESKTVSDTFKIDDHSISPKEQTGEKLFHTNGITPDTTTIFNEMADTLSVANSTIKEITERNAFPSKFSVLLTLAPDFSTTNLGRYSSPGEAIGLLISYQAGKRISLYTGAIRNAKKYKGYGNEYQPPPGYWKNRTNGIIPDRIKGACTVLEIPVNVRYDILQKPKNRFFISAGVSSYVMLDEYYQYTFESPNPGAATGWETKESSSYMFGIGAISLGYERHVHQNWAIGVEPYLKIPFTGMGWTNIDLYSTGVYFTLRYKIRKRTDHLISGRRQED